MNKIKLNNHQMTLAVMAVKDRAVALTALGSTELAKRCEQVAAILVQGWKNHKGSNIVELASDYMACILVALEREWDRWNRLQCDELVQEFKEVYRIVDYYWVDIE